MIKEKLMQMMVFTIGTYMGAVRTTVAVTLGGLLGILPHLLFLQTFIVFLVMIFFQLPFRIFLLSFVFTFMISAQLLDSLYHWLGESVLEAAWLRTFWSWMYNVPLLPFLGSNNTVVTGGSLFVFFILAPICYFLCLQGERRRINGQVN